VDRDHYEDCNQMTLNLSIVLNIISFMMSPIIFLYLPTDPLDVSLIINEQALFLSTKYSSLEKITTT
jgi:hypothetical protein